MSVVGMADIQASSVSVVMPAATSAGLVDITIQTSDNGDITLPDAYTYNPAGVIAGGSVTQAFTIGSGTATNATSGAAPINIYFRSRHFQFVYTTNDLADAGLVGPAEIVALGVDVVQAPDYNLPSFQVRMKHTMANDMNGGFESSGLDVCYNNAVYAPAAGGFDMLAFAQPFTWNGTNNLILDTAFALTTSYSASGRSTYDPVTSRGRYLQSDSADQSDVFSGGFVFDHLPRIRVLARTVGPQGVTPDSGTWTGGTRSSSRGRI